MSKLAWPTRVALTTTTSAIGKASALASGAGAAAVADTATQALPPSANSAAIAFKRTGCCFIFSPDRLLPLVRIVVCVDAGLEPGWRERAAVDEAAHSPYFLCRQHVAPRWHIDNARADFAGIYRHDKVIIDILQAAPLQRASWSALNSPFGVAKLVTGPKALATRAQVRAGAEPSLEPVQVVPVQFHAAPFTTLRAGASSAVASTAV